MSMKICPMCKGTGRIEVKTMNLQKVRNLLKDHINLHANHGLRHLDMKDTVEGCFKSILKISGLALEELEKEEPEPPKPPKLRIKGGGFYYFNDGTESIVPIGAFPRQLLRVVKGYRPEDLPLLSSEYIAKAKSSGINKIRLDVVDDYDLTYDFAADMKEHNIIVEYTMKDRDRPHFGDHKEHIRRLKSLNNVIAECWNEFCRAHFIQADIDKALEIANYALAEGMIVSGGAWGNSSAGEAMSEAFQQKFKGQVWTIHRPYPPRHVLEVAVDKALALGFAVSWNEGLMKPYPTGIEADKLEAYTRCLADKKASVMLYIRCEEFMDLMGTLCKDYNA